MENLPYCPVVLYWYYWQWKIFHMCQWCYIDINDNRISSIFSSEVVLLLLTMKDLPYFPAVLYWYYWKSGNGRSSNRLPWPYQTSNKTGVKWQWKIFHIFQGCCIGITENVRMEDLPIISHGQIIHQIKQE